MKKIILIMLIIFIGSQDLQSQAKWRKELLLQIAALQVYIGYAKKGYSVVKKGLNFIGDVKKGEVNLHSDYYKSLKKINPKIKKYSRVGEIIFLQIKIIKISNSTFKYLKKDDLFNGNELDYIERSFGRLFQNCSRTLDELLIVTQDDNIEMKDDQRIKRIDGLYRIMMQDYTFCKTFSQETQSLLLSRHIQRNETELSRSLYGL